MVEACLKPQTEPQAPGNVVFRFVHGLVNKTKKNKRNEEKKTNWSVKLINEFRYCLFCFSLPFDLIRANWIFFSVNLQAVSVLSHYNAHSVLWLLLMMCMCDMTDWLSEWMNECWHCWLNYHCHYHYHLHCCDEGDFHFRKCAKFWKEISIRSSSSQTQWQQTIFRQSISVNTAFTISNINTPASVLTLALAATEHIFHRSNMHFHSFWTQRQQPNNTEPEKHKHFHISYYKVHHLLSDGYGYSLPLLIVCFGVWVCACVCVSAFIGLLVGWLARFIVAFWLAFWRNG